MNQTDRDALVQQVIQVAGSILVLYLAKKVMQPDFGKALQMRGALTVKRIADAQINLWQQVSSDAATMYHNAKV